MKKQICVVLLLALTLNVSAQEGLFQKDFEWKEFTDRRNRIMDSIGSNAIAIVQGALSVTSFEVFRQTNEFYYLTGLEIPHAYILLDGRKRKSTLYIPHRDEGRERGEGKRLSAEDATLIVGTTGIEEVKGIEMLSPNLASMLIRYPLPNLFTPHSPGEGKAGSRDEAVIGYARIAADPWTDEVPKEARFINLMQERFPQFEIRDLSPIMDEMRLIKSEKEIKLIRKASQIAGAALIEAMKATKPGVMEYQLGAVAKYHYLMNDAKYDGYSAIIGGGTNAWHGHYFHNKDELKGGDMVLMDYAPDYHYYTSDVTRIWPVNGKFTQGQIELYGVITAWYKELTKRIKPGVSAQQITEETAAALKPIIAKMKFSKEIYRKAAEGALTFTGALSHPVGMAVHDVGNYKKGLLQPGMVFSIDPMIWIPDEKLYVRVEDVGVVTDKGFENFSAFVPIEVKEIEKIIQNAGMNGPR